VYAPKREDDHYLRSLAPWAGIPALPTNVRRCSLPDFTEIAAVSLVGRHTRTVPTEDVLRKPSTFSRDRIIRLLLAGAFPTVLIAVIVAFGLVLELRGGRAVTSPATLAAELIGVSVVVGVAGMAVVQVVKSLLGIRGLYQRRQVRGWFTREHLGEEGYQQFLKALGAAGAGGPQALDYLFDLPIELVCAQVSGAADVALADPKSFQAFLECLAGQAAVAGVTTQEKSGSGSLRSDESDPALADHADAQIRLSHYIRTGIDQLQVSVGHRWRTYTRATAMWVSGLIGIAIVEVSHPPTRERGLYVLSSVLVGGFISWFVRDVVAVVERLRG
jgi:hypothetical protein